MSLLRFACLLALAVWVGGLAILGGVAAPVLFAVLDARDPTGGTALAGLLFGAIFRRFQHVSWALGGLLVLLLAVRAALGPRPRRLGARLWTVIVMLGMSLTSAFVLAPRIDKIRAETNGAVSMLPDGDARKTELVRLHAAASVMMLATIAAGAGLMWIEMRDHA
jgi:hypothetical protein